MNNVSRVYARRLCAGCGACAAACPAEAISFSLDRRWGLLKPCVDGRLCSSCGKCLRVCPGEEISFEKLRPSSFDGEFVQFLGHSRMAFAGYSLNAETRFNGASGGLLTELLIHLLESRELDGAVVIRNKEGPPFGFEPFVAGSEADLRSAQKSKYYPTPVCSIFSRLGKEGARLAFVGLPCHVAALRKAQLEEPWLKERLPLVLSLFCSRLPNANATIHLLREMGLDPEKVASIDYRGQGHPGKLRVIMKGGDERWIDHLDPLYWGYAFMKFFKPVRCWLCPDHSGMLADASFADNWTAHEANPDGSTMALVRSSSAERALLRLRDAKRAALSEIPVAEAVSSQDIRYKADIAPRMAIWRACFGKLPKYDIANPDSKPSLRELAGALPELVRTLLSSAGGSRSFLRRCIAGNRRIEEFADEHFKLRWR